MYFKAILFILGTCSLFGLSRLPGPPVLLAVPIVAWLLWHPRWRLAAMLPAGFLWAILHAYFAVIPDLAGIEDRTVLVDGVVTGAPERRAPHRQRFLLLATRLDDGTGWRAFRCQLRLNWYGASRAPVAGERWQLAVRLKRPYGMANPGGFDHERWLFQQRIRATGYVRTDDRNRRLSGGHLSPLAAYRGRLLRAFERLGEGTGAAFVRALTVGERGAIGAMQWRVLNATGTSHLMAISGLHISLVGGLAFWLVRRAWSWLPRGADVMPAPRAAAVVALTAATLYALLAGFGIPARRALVMIAVLMLALLADRRASFGRIIGTAAVVTLVIDPLSVLSAGWWLSFLAVGIIAWLVTGRSGPRRRAGQRLRLHVALALGMAPVLLLLFQQASLVAPLANLFAVPYTGLLVVPLALSGCALFALDESLGSGLLGVAALLLELAWPALQWLADVELAAWVRHQPPLWTLPPALAGLALLVQPRGVPGRWTGLVLLLPLLTVRPAAPPPGSAWITLLDVGQGLSAVVRTAQRTLVYDAGPRFGPQFDTGQAVVTPFLRREGLTRLDTLVVSHGDNDHIGGVASLLAAYPAATIYSSVPDRLPAGTALSCRRGMRWRWDGVEFAILHPGTEGGSRGNDGSCVLRIGTADGQHLLLTGDIERGAERQLLAAGSDALRAEVLVAPHHGSATSSSPEFIAAVNPEVVIVPAAWRNRYRFPQRDVVERYRARGTAILVTGRSGAVTIRLAPGSERPQVETWRERYRHVWSWRE
jgi:competence protein ComEC